MRGSLYADTKKAWWAVGESLQTCLAVKEEEDCCKYAAI